MNYGDTFFIKQNGRLFDSHLWMVISDPQADAHNVLIVNLTTWDRDKDLACILESGDHPFIRHRTCVNYRDAKILTADFLDRNLRLGLIVPQSRASDELIAAIIQGAGVSRFISFRCRDLLVQQGLLEE